MRLGIDYLAAATHAPGTGRYARELVRALVRLPEPPDLRLLEVGRAAREVPEEALGLDGRPVRRLVRRWPRRVLGVLGAVGLGADRLLGGLDLFHQPAVGPWVPLRRALRTVTVAEVPVAGEAVDAVLAPRLGSAAAVLVFSEAARTELIRRRLAAPGDVRLVPVGCDHWSRELAGPLARAEPPEVLVLGARSPARRHVPILRAVESLAARGLPCTLRVVGRDAADDAFARAVAASPCRASVRVDAPDEASLPATVAAASVLVHLNDREHTAVTLLEACALGPAVVASSLPAFAEELADHALFVDNAAVDDDVDVLVEAVARALERADDEVARGRRRAHAATRTWSACAAAHLEVWSSLVA